MDDGCWPHILSYIDQHLRAWVWALLLSSFSRLSSLSVLGGRLLVDQYLILTLAMHGSQVVIKCFVDNNVDNTSR